MNPGIQRHQWDGPMICQMPHRFSRHLISGITMLVCLIAVTSSHADTVKVFLLAGQSNMVGQARQADLPENMQQPQDDVLFFYNYKSKASGLTKLGPGSGNQFGPEITFGRTVADGMPDEKFAIIKFAVNGSNLYNHWKPTDDNRGAFYKRFVKVVEEGLTALKEAGHTPQIVGMLWAQGEADAMAKRTTEQYQEDLIAFIADVRQRYGNDLPFFFNSLSDGQRQIPAEQRQAIRAAQEAVAAADSKAYLIATDGLKQTDTVHWNAQGQIELGIRYGNAYLETQGSAAQNKAGQHTAEMPASK